jgi:hypothetical protein
VKTKALELTVKIDENVDRVAVAVKPAHQLSHLSEVSELCATTETNLCAAFFFLCDVREKHEQKVMG